MERKPLVSVIVPFLNVEAFLEEAVRSVLAQDYSHWELILVDDGSTDGSTRIAKEYAAKVPEKIYYWDHPGHGNKGPSFSRNEGVRRSHGELIATLDSDDVWLPSKLSRQVELFGRHRAVAMAVEGSMYWYDWDGREKENRVVRIGAKQDHLFEPRELTRNLYPLGKGVSPCPSSMMITRDAFLRVGGFEAFFSGDLSLYEDQAFFAKVYLGEMVYVSSECNNWYRQRRGSVMDVVKSAGKYHAVRHFFLEWFEAYLRDSGIYDHRIDQLLQEALLPYRHRWRNYITRRLPRKAKRVVKGWVFPGWLGGRGRVAKG